MKTLGLIVLALTLTTASNAIAEDAKKTKPLSVGSLVEDFSLRDLDGTERRLHAIKDSKVIVLALTGPDCPIAEQYVGTLAQFAASFEDKGVTVLGLNANRQDEVPELRAFKKSRELEFPILKDHKGAVVDQLGATRTTEVFVLDKDFKLRYRGRIDDQFSITDRSVGFRKDKAEKHFMQDAVEALLAGEEIKISTTDAVGCIIGRELEKKGDVTATFHEDVQPIMNSKCLPCHRDGQIGPFELESYDDAAGWAGMIREVVENRRMPPWHADPKHGEFENDRSLTKSERETILAWVDSGAPQGDPAKSPKTPTFSDGWQIGEPDAVYEMRRAYRVPARGTVRYQYFTLPTNLKEDRWVKQMEVRAGVRDVVHHILVFCVDPKDPRGWQRQTRGGIQGYFAAMVPGERPISFPEGMGKRIPAGATLIFQVHYTTNGEAAEDKSKIGLVFAKEEETKNIKEVRTRSAYARSFRIPPETEAHEVRAFFSLNKSVDLLSFLPHMHLRGSGFQYNAHYPTEVTVSKSPWSGRFERSVLRRLRFDDSSKKLTWIGKLSDENYELLAKLYTSDEDRKKLDELKAKSKSEVLLSVPAYDFGWQNSYRLAKPKRMPKGSIIEGIAHFDNSERNPALTKDMRSRSVRWGDQTWQEMMIGYFDCVVAD